VTRRQKVIGAAAAALVAATAFQAISDGGVQERGELMLFRSEGGCTVNDEAGVRVRWSPDGATLEPVLWPVFASGPKATGPARALPLPRARELVRTFQGLLRQNEPDATLFAERSTSVWLRAGSLEVQASLDARPWASYAERLKVQAERTHGVLDWLRYQTYRAGLWHSRGLKAEPAVDALLREASAQDSDGIQPRAAASTCGHSSSAQRS
jgi:hypothetical protein